MRSTITLPCIFKVCIIVSVFILLRRTHALKCELKGLVNNKVQCVLHDRGINTVEALHFHEIRRNKKDTDPEFLEPWKYSTGLDANKTFSEAESVEDFKKHLQNSIPGTSWCGEVDRNTAILSYEDLTLFVQTDSCCKKHEACVSFIEARDSKYELNNNGLLKRFHCDCEKKFRDCLKNSKNNLADKIGFTYFTIVGPQCFREDNPKLNCTKRILNRCLHYKFDRKEEKKYQCHPQIYLKNFGRPYWIKMSAPNWISFELFQTALKNYLNDNVQLLTFTSTNAVPDGDNYTSDLFRSTLIYLDNKNQKCTLSVIVKCANEEGGVKTDLAKNLHLFDKEIEMFTRTFPAIYDILGDYYTLSSKCLYTSTHPHSVMVLEDLTTLDFQMLPRHIGFDLEHCFKVVEKMAQMHAASVIMYEKDPSLVKHYSEGLYADNEMIREWVGAGYTALSDACSRWPAFEKYGYKLKALGDEALERGFRSYKRKLGGFHVLNHGDLWVNNMMFSYDQERKLKDMRFVDFQMNIFTSPAIDLHYFIATSTKIEVKIDCIELILDHYYAQLLANLAKLQYSLERVPTREQFKKDYNSRAFYGLMGAATVLAFVKASSRKDASFESIMRDSSLEGFRYHAYNNDRYRKHMEHLLPYYDSFGILDY